MKASNRLLLAIFLILGALDAHAQVPSMINYQGRVIVGTTNFNGTGSFKFALVNSNASITYWSNDGTSTAGSQPTNAVLLTVTNGLYSVALGEIGNSNMTAVPASVFSNNDVRLRVWFNDGVQGSQLLSPDQRIVATGYAMVAASVSDGAITAAKIANGAVTSLQLGNGAVGTAQLADAGITSGKIANNAVTSAQLGLGAVTTPNLQLGGIGAAQIGDGTITAAKIGSGQLVKSVNGLTDALTLAAGTNISITPSGNTLTLAATSNIWRLNGSSAYYVGGNVGIGINNPSSSLHINTTDDAIRLTATQPYITFEDSGSGSYSRIQGNAAGLDLKTLGVMNGSNTGAYVHLDGTGRLGLGTFAPAHQLTIAANAGTPSWTSNGWLGEVALDNSAAIAWGTNSAGNRFGMGHTNGGFLMFRTAANPGTSGSAAVYDFTVNDSGNVGVGTNLPVNKLDVRGGNITTDSNLGVGTTSPGDRFDVVGTGNVTAQVTTASGDAIISLVSTISGATRNWTIEDGLYGTAGLFGIYDRTVGKARLTIDTAGTVTVPVLSITGGADVAEPFPMGAAKIQEGSVVVIDSEHPGCLKQSTRAYDKRVAGIVSGANGINPGIALHQDGALEGGQNVALSGRVYVHADTSNGEIEAGDMLTSSDTPGCAMKATDHTLAQGAVIGKAMSPLRDKRGTVLVLVSLQ